MLWAVIMAGGVGSRFWPESRRKMPKQFLPLLGSKPLLVETIDRLRGVIPPSRTFIITQRDKVKLVHQLAPLVPRSQVIGEPVGRNTAPCAAIAAALALQKDPDAVISLLPADQRIKKAGAFRQALRAAYQAAQDSGNPVTFGVRPSYPHTGYGYLEIDRLEQRHARFPVYRLKRFHEKPNHVKAVRFCRSRRFLWNSGIFVWRAQSLLGNVRRYLPRVHRWTVHITQKNFVKRMAASFHRMSNISIDYGLMEKMRGKILTIPVELEWNDVGGWRSLQAVCRRDKQNNVLFGKTLVVNSSGNVVRAGKRLIALVGLRDHVVVDTEDATLVCALDQTEAIREIVRQLKQRKWTRYL